MGSSICCLAVVRGGEGEGQERHGQLKCILGGLLISALLGSVAGIALIEHSDVRKVGFTGSTDVGKDIMRRLASVT